MIRMVLAMLLLLCAVTATRAQPKAPTDHRDELRYGGKPFAYWVAFPRTERKPEWRIDALHAMAAFGLRGYAKEATAAIVAWLKDYENDEQAFWTYQDPNPAKDTPDQRVIREAIWALGKIGPEAAPTLLAHLDRKEVRSLADHLFGDKYQMTVTKPPVPILVRWVLSKNSKASLSAIGMLGNALEAEPKDRRANGCWAAFVQLATEPAKVREIVDTLAQAVTSMESFQDAQAALLLGALGIHAKPAVPDLVRAELWMRFPVGSVAQQALAQIKPTAAERIPGLLAELKDEQSHHRALAARKLGELGAAARAVAGDLAAEIRKPIPEGDAARQKMDERLSFVQALVRIAPRAEARPIVADVFEQHPLALLDGELLRTYLALGFGR